MRRSTLIAAVLIAVAGTSAHGADRKATGSAAQADTEAMESASASARKRAQEILHQMLAPDMASGMTTDQPTSGFGKEMSRIAFENAFVQLWTRPGLSVKERSMITIPMLIALGSERELKIHLAAGLRNGLTREQLEEIIYHSSAYVGFPRASTALAIATEVMDEQGNSDGRD